MEKNYIDYLKTSSDTEVITLVKSFESQEIDFQKIVEMISPVKHDVMSYQTFLKSQKLDDLLNNL